MSSVVFDLKRGAMKTTPVGPREFDLHAIFEDDDWGPALTDPLHTEYSINASTAATSRAVAVSVHGGRPVELSVLAMAGHRSFATMQSRRNARGWVVTNSSNTLGVGMTGTYGIRLAKSWRMTPFVSLDYNRIDSARYVDRTGPNPYLTDNADTGLTGSMGATISHRFGAERRFRALAYGAIIAATSAGEPPREFGSIGARFVHAIGDSAIKATWEEAGFGLDYRLTPRARINGAVVHTLDRLDGDAVAAKFGLRVAL